MDPKVPRVSFWTTGLMTDDPLFMEEIDLLDLDVLMAQDVKDFFNWYSSKCGGSGFRVLKFNLMEVRSGPSKHITVADGDSDAFQTLKDIISVEFSALTAELAGPGMSIMLIPDVTGSYINRHFSWLQLGI